MKPFLKLFEFFQKASQFCWRKLFEILFFLVTIHVRYDCDSDFYPKFANGKKAHWVTICGVCYGSPDKTSETNSTVVQHLSSEDFLSMSMKIKPDLYFWTSQGKSKLFRSFRAVDLVRSNFQLNDVDPALSREQYIFPSDSKILDTLSHQAIYIELANS